MNPRKRLGLQIHLAQGANEQKLVNSLATYSSSWLRIKFDQDEIKTDDPIQGKAECLISMTSSNQTIKKQSFLKTGFNIRFQKPTRKHNQQST